VREEQLAVRLLLFVFREIGLLLGFVHETSLMRNEK
jgi:hypothetical protein